MYCFSTYNLDRLDSFNKHVFDSVISPARKEDFLSLIGQSFLGNAT